jgi:catechol 2,3-dioxygenase-like lactoylglutathione lyase family enzyme
MNHMRTGERNDTSDHSPGTFAATSLAVSLTVDDLAASTQWYRDVLGFTIAREFERGGVRFATRLRAGAVELLLTQDDGAKGPRPAKGGGFSISFTTAQSVDDLATRAKALGAVLDTEPADQRGMRVFRLRDPDGFRLVISSERSA